MNRLISCSLVLAALVLLTVPTLADDAKDKEADKPKTHTVQEGPFKVEVTLDGVFEARHSHEIILRPEVWSTLKVDEVVEEGAMLNEGQTILKLETEDLDKEIQSQEFALRLSDLSLQQAKVELDVLEKSVPLDLEAARRAQRIAEEDLEYYLKVTERQRKESAKESLKSAEYSLEYAQEELDQLNQMYKADDLTEETEEIILKRAQRSVERSEFFLEQAKERYELTIQTTIPREKQQEQEADVRARISLRKAEATLPESLIKQKIELEKAQESHAQLEEKLEDLRKDRELLIVKSPAEGRLYYGQADRGKWTTAAAVRKQLRPGGSVTANSVLFTIVGDGDQFVRVDIPETDFRHFDEGTPAVVKPTAFPQTKYQGECGLRGPVAVKEGTFDGRVEFEAGDDQPRPIAGMTCKVTITPYEKQDAITVPSSAIFGEDNAKVVYLEDGGESKEQSVKIGRTSGDKTEILEGLKKGDVILLEKP